MIVEHDPPLKFNGRTYRYKFFLPDSLDSKKRVFEKFVRKIDVVPACEVGFDNRWERGAWIYLNDDAHAVLFHSMIEDRDAP